MLVQDIEIAKQQLYDKHLTLAIAKDGNILFQTDSHRISGFMRAIEELGTQLSGASVADRVAGKALALLCVFAEIREVYAEVLSKKAQAIFEANNVTLHWKQLVDNVLDLNKVGVCPFEKVAAEISDPKKSFTAFKDLREKMKPCE